MANAQDWEFVSTEERPIGYSGLQPITETQRLRVPGGWIYKVRSLRKGGSDHMVVVMDNVIDQM